MHWCLRSFSLIALRLVCLSLADTLRIDDSNQTVLYQGTWSNGHEVPDDMSKDWDHTVHYSNSSGATATLIFTGTSIAVYGSIHPPGGSAMRSLYTIDDQQPSVTFTPPQEVPTSTHRTLFYSSPWFPYGEHTLVVTNLGDQFFLDFFDVQDESVSTTPAASTPSPTVPTDTSISSPNATQTVTVTSTGSTQPEASDSSETSDTDTQGATADSQTSSVTKPLAPASKTTAPPPPTTGAARPSTSTPAGGPTATPTGAAHPHTNGRSSPRTLSKGAIAGIAVGSAIIVAVLGAGLWWYWRSRSRERTWLVTFEPEKMTVPDPAFRGHRPTLPGFGLGGLGSGSGSDATSLRDALGRRGASRSAHRRSASVPSSSSSVHLVGYGNGSSTPSTCSE